MSPEACIEQERKKKKNMFLFMDVEQLGPDQSPFGFISARNFLVNHKFFPKIYSAPV